MIWTRKFTKWLCNGILLLVAVVVLSLCLLNLVNPQLPVIQCQGSMVTDSNILHKYSGDTVTMTCLLLIIITVPLTQILVIEILHNYAEYFINKSPFRIQSKPWKRGLFYGLRFYRDYVFGITFMILLNDICKSTVNSPRPHFVDSCKPNFTETDCKHGWVDSYVCTNDNISRWRLADSRKSFPSGHAALAMFSTVFMVLYQHYRLTMKRHGVVVLFWCHLAWIGWGFFCSLSRLVDFRHHAEDIIVGGLIGTTGALFTVLYICKKFRENLKPDFFENHSRMVNGSASVVVSNSSLPQCQIHQSISMPTELNGSIPGTKNTTESINSRILGNNQQRPSLRRLLSSQSTLTQMSEIAEDRELETI